MVRGDFCAAKRKNYVQPLCAVVSDLRLHLYCYEYAQCVHTASGY